ncbi:MAG: hypothetical protein ACYTFY_08295 [Planctomycetota bacterium]
MKRSLISIMLTVIIAVTCGCKQKDTGWQLLHKDNFERAEIGNFWKTAEGSWKIDNGTLVGKGPGLIVFNKKLSGCQKIKFEIMTDKPGDLSPVIHTDGSKRASGYFLQFGGNRNRINKASRMKEYIAYDNKTMIQKRKWHTVIGEFDGLYVKLTVDGREVYKYREGKPLLGRNYNFAGLYIYYTAKVRSAEVYTKPYVKSSTYIAKKKRQVNNKVNMMTGGGAEDYNEFVRWSGVCDRELKDSHSGKASFKFPFVGMATSGNYIEVDQSKTYELSGWFKSLKPNQLSRMLLDIRFYTKDKKNIGPGATCPMTSVSRLAKDVKPGDKKVYIKGSDWKLQRKSGFLVFNAKADLSDLPNPDHYTFNAFSEKDGTYEVVLRRIIKNNYKAGTPVRVHRYIDFARTYKVNVPAEWTKYSFKFGKNPGKGLRVQYYHWPGAKYMRAAIIHQYNKYPKRLPKGMEQPAMLMDDLVLREVNSQQ